MKQKSSLVAQRLLNLYRQAHVIFGGWETVNKVFVADSNPDVIEEIKLLPTGKFLAEHIQNLRSGQTPMDSIERELLPYGGMMTESVVNIELSDAEWASLENAINSFTPDEQGLANIENLDIIRKFGDNWTVAVRAALINKPELLEKWANIKQTYRAYNLWNTASDLLKRPLSDRTRAQLQAEMPEYETYLPMFGDAGNQILGQLRNLISTRELITADEEDI